ncbi:hypothetical protein [Hymenobacter arizonensis]|uniref:Phosphate-selective porin O and P n=1 Tax=Hymenobacter arizonensis TaxID=1227077 RepID=A0A1I5Y1J6_HYMAR|nr:hypothetical protein [Hymenobacter arizonensis]SFQ38058.1 hypothetical protein SAMN04515668_2163 [Hymenobacter arizonensis]
MKINFYSRIVLLLGLLVGVIPRASAQRTHIRGFVDALTYYENGKVNFGLGEQDLFITSEITERLSFLGETVFRFSLASPTNFNISVERIILKYNYAGNHSVLLGKHHTPINYWNDTYHHGRVFFPTIDRPLLFAQGIIPLHTTGVSLQGQNLGAIRFGYDAMVGNGIGSGDVVDNNPVKSVTLAVHIKPTDGMRLGASLYHDAISKGSTMHNHSGNGGVRPVALTRINQDIVTGSISYTDSVSSRKFELLAESSMVSSQSDSLGMQRAVASYVYAGLRLTEKFIPYVRFDDIRFTSNREVYFLSDNTQSFVAGLRYELSYLAVLKLEYQRANSHLHSNHDRVTFQVAVGF